MLPCIHPIPPPPKGEKDCLCYTTASLQGRRKERLNKQRERKKSCMRTKGKLTLKRREECFFCSSETERGVNALLLLLFLLLLRPTDLSRLPPIPALRREERGKQKKGEGRRGLFLGGGKQRRREKRERRRGTDAQNSLSLSTPAHYVGGPFLLLLLLPARPSAGVNFPSLLRFPPTE